MRLTVSPAGAGMDPAYSFSCPSSISFPRRRGDGPEMNADERRRFWFPPQARGWTLHEDTGVLHYTVSPAGAGMDRSSCIATAPRHCFPRRRGDGPVVVLMRGGEERFPPQARGWTRIG